MGPCDLDAMLAALPRATPELARLLDTRDDAGVFDLGDGRCLLQTIDFFPPIVDSGYWFGQIAAAGAAITGAGARAQGQAGKQCRDRKARKISHPMLSFNFRSRRHGSK